MLNRGVNNTLHTLWHCVHYKCTYQKYTGCFHQLWGSITSNDVCQLKNDNRVEKHRAPYTESRFTQSSALVLRHVLEKMLAHFAVSTLPVEHALQITWTAPAQILSTCQTVKIYSVQCCVLSCKKQYSAPVYWSKMFSGTHFCSMHGLLNRKSWVSQTLL